MTFLSRLTRPRVPRAACLLDVDEVAVVQLKRRSDKFSIDAAARTPLSSGLVVPSFDAPNIPDRDALASIIDSTVRAAGLARRQRWSLLLPEAAIKSLVISFESTPSSRSELAEMMDWKIERMVGTSARELRISRQFVGAGDTPRFLAVVGRNDVLGEYDALAATLGWSAGILVPRYFGEAAWFDWDTRPGDKLLVGVRSGTLTAAVVRSGELILVRTLDGDPARVQDEIYRLALFYRDRVADTPESANVSSVLVHGDVDGAGIAATVADALGREPALFRPFPDALELDSTTSMNPALLAAAGMASQHWTEQ